MSATASFQMSPYMFYPCAIHSSGPAPQPDLYDECSPSQDNAASYDTPETPDNSQPPAHLPPDCARPTGGQADVLAQHVGKSSPGDGQKTGAENFDDGPALNSAYSMYPKAMSPLLHMRCVCGMRLRSV